jgi:O-antigen ligase
MWVTLMIEATVFVFLYLRKTAKSGRNANTWSWVIAGAVCSLFLALFLIVSHVKGRTEGVSVAQIEQSFSYDLRPKIWSYALQRIRERPLKGYGYGRGILRADFRSHLNNRGAWHAHNVILNYMLEAGPLGVLALLGLFVALLREFWKLYRSEHRSAWQCGACALALLLGVASKAMTDDILVRDNALLFWSQIGMILGLARHMAEDSTRGRKLDLPGT